MVIPDMSTKWFEMGLRLCVDTGVLERIEYDFQDSRTACRHMFKEWLENTQTEKSWNKILQALCSRSVGKSCLAKCLVAAAK